jgi:hypothetical protein
MWLFKLFSRPKPKPVQTSQGDPTASFSVDDSNPNVLFVHGLFNRYHPKVNITNDSAKVIAYCHAHFGNRRMVLKDMGGDPSNISTSTANPLARPNRMPLHPRTMVVNQAKAEIGMAISNIVIEHKLTYAELFGILGGEISGVAKFALREERHPDDPGKGGDEE